MSHNRYYITIQVVRIGLEDDAFYILKRVFMRYYDNYVYFRL
jgi:hypothetical protein